MIFDPRPLSFEWTWKDWLRVFLWVFIFTALLVIFGAR